MALAAVCEALSPIPGTENTKERRKVVELKPSPQAIKENMRAQVMS